MTISTTASSVTLNGDGSNKTWNYSFLIPLASDVQVSTSVGGVTTVLDPSVYSITVGNPAGGTVTYPLSGAALANGSTITIARNLPLTQTTQLTDQGSFDPSVVEDALDFLTMLIQDLNTTVGGLDVAGVEASATQVTQAVNSFNNMYLGSKAADPTGTTVGQLYFNTTSNAMKVYNGSTWQVSYNPSSGTVNSFNGRTGTVVPASGDYTITEISGAATVASTGAYSDLAGKPVLATVATSGLYSDLSGKPTLAMVATTGAYGDLSGRPSLGTAAAYSVGTSANNVVVLTTGGALPAVSGANLTNLPVTVPGYRAIGSNALTNQFASPGTSYPASTFSLGSGTWLCTGSVALDVTNGAGLSTTEYVSSLTRTS